MKIKIVAISPHDGWAFVEEDGRFFLLTPPYDKSDKIESTEMQLEKSISFHGFEICSYELNNYREVLDFIKSKYLESLKSQNFIIPSDEELRKLLKYADEKIIDKYLDKICNE
jgi:hypothetical protein